LGQSETDHNRQLVFEADSLAQIDWQQVTPNFDQENCLKFLEYFKRRSDKFKTATGIKARDKLLAQCNNYWD